MYRDVGDFQVPGKDIEPVRRKLTGGPSEFGEGITSLELKRETAMEVGGGATSVRDVLSGGGPGSFTV